MDGRARGRRRPDQGQPAVRAHRQGRRGRRSARLPGVLGGGARRAAGCRARSVLHATNWERVREIDLFALVLVVQSLPFLAAVALAALEGSRVNDFAFWRGLEAQARRPDAGARPRPPWRPSSSAGDLAGAGRHADRSRDARGRAGAVALAPVRATARFMRRPYPSDDARRDFRAAFAASRYAAQRGLRPAAPSTTCRPGSPRR